MAVVCCNRECFFCLLLTLLTIISCVGKESDRSGLHRHQADDLKDILGRGILRVATIENAVAYYVDDNGVEHGYDYDLSRSFADYLGVEHQLILASDVRDLIARLTKGEADIIAYRLQMSAGNRKKMAFVSNVEQTKMVLVQRREKQQITDVTELLGQTVCVRNGSKYMKRMRNLNNELGGDVIVDAVPDSVTTEDLIKAVSRGEIKYCVADENVVRLIDSKLKNINYSVPVGFNSPKAWAVRNGADSLLVEFNNWYDSIKGGKFIQLLENKYIDGNSYFDKYESCIPVGAVSPYDDIFRREADKIGWDWRLLAAVARNESNFNTRAMSSQGALGIMQMMPRTAAKFGLTGDDIYDPDKNITAGVLYIKHLDFVFKDIENREERIKFILAGYNAGPGHVFDAMRIAEKYGSNPHLWNGNVEQYLLKLHEERFYKDELCRHGYFRGRRTVSYVGKVYQTYNEYCGL